METADSHGTSLNPEIAAKLHEARFGSANAMGGLLEDCRPYLLFIANRELDSDLRSKSAPSDLVQDTFVAAQQSFKSFDGTSHRELLNWLTQILTYRLQNNFRKYRQTQKRSVNRERPLEHAKGALVANPKAKQKTPSEVASTIEDEVRVQRALSGLQEEYQQVIELRTWQRRSFDEVGRLLDRTPEAARKLWHRAVITLGKRLEESE